MSQQVDIVKNGYLYPDNFKVTVSPLVDSEGNVIKVTKTGLELQLSHTDGIEIISPNVSSGTYTPLDKKWVITTVDSETPAYFSYIARVTDETKSPFTVTLSPLSFTGDDEINCHTGLTHQDILDDLAGQVGPAGPATDIVIGTVSAGAAAAVITGTSPNLTLDLTIPAGAQGIQGIDGPTGPTGVTDYAALTSRPNIVTATGGNITGEVNLTNGTFELTSPASFVGLAGNEGVAGIKTFSEIPVFSTGVDIGAASTITGILTVTGKVTGTSAPAAGIDLTNKTYVDAQIPVNVSELANDSGYVTSDTQLTDEQVQDAMETALVHAFHTDTNVVYNDANNRFEITSTVVGGAADGVITGMVKVGDDLTVTGVDGAFNGNLPDVYKDTQNTYVFARNGDNVDITKNGGADGSFSIIAAAVSAHTHVIADTTNLQIELDSKQDTLVSATNIKTVNGNSLVGAGNIDVDYVHPNHSGEVTSVADGATALALTAISNKSNVTANGSDYVLIQDVSLGTLSRTTVDSLVDTKSYVGSSNSQTFRGAVTGAALVDRTFIFPKTTSEAAYTLKSIAIYGRAITGTFEIDVTNLSADAAVGTTRGYTNGDGTKTFAIGDVDTDGYAVVLSELVPGTGVTSLIGITLYYE